MEVFTCEHHAFEIPANIGIFSNDTTKDDLNHAEEANVQKCADLCGGFDQEVPSSEYRAIRQKCLWCCNGSPKEVRLCPSTHCPLNSLRMGKRSELAPRPLRSIRAKCRECSEKLKDIVACEVDDCPIWPYRLGKRPRGRRTTGVANFLGYDKEAR